MISLTACFLGIVISVFGALYPSEKFAGQIKIIFSLIFILCLAKPIAEGKFELPDISGTIAASTDYYNGLRDNADEYFISSVESNINASLKAVLGEIGIYPREIKTSINISENCRISINKVGIVTDSPADAEAAERCVKEKLGEDTAVVVVCAESEGTE